MALVKLKDVQVEAKSEKVTAENFEVKNDNYIYISKGRETVIEGYFLNHFNEESSLSEKDVHVVHTVPKVGKVISNKAIHRKIKEGKPEAFYDTDAYKICELSNRMNASKNASKNNMATEYQRSIESYIKFFVTKFSAKVPNEKGELTDVVKTPNIPVLIPVNMGDLFFASASSGMANVLIDALIGDEEAGEPPFPLESNKVKLSFKSIKVLMKNPLSKEVKEIKEEVERLRSNPEILEEQFKHLAPVAYDTWYRNHVATVAGQVIVDVTDEDEVDESWT